MPFSTSPNSPSSRLICSRSQFFCFSVRAGGRRAGFSAISELICCKALRQLRRSVCRASVWRASSRPLSLAWAELFARLLVGEEGPLWIQINVTIPRTIAIRTTAAMVPFPIERSV